MATIVRPLSIFILCLGCVCLQSPDHYQSLFRVQDRCGYNRHTIINRYFVSRMCMFTISRPLLIFIFLSRIGMATLSRTFPIFILCPGWIWLQSPDHYQSLFCV
jgi:hypothetical protein